MGYIELIKVTDDQLDTCDECYQKGLKTSGRTIVDSYGDPVMWLCFNCVQRILR